MVDAYSLRISIRVQLLVTYLASVGYNLSNAGNPDAADWDDILKSQNSVIKNINEQYKINSQFVNATAEVTRRLNELVIRMNEISSNKETEEIGRVMLSQTLILKDEINDIIRACQIAKSGIINTNLLDFNEVEELVMEMKTLPYANAIEAIEYGTPSIFTNGNLLLYVLSMLKVEEQIYDHLILRAAIDSSKQIDLPFGEVLVRENQTLGLKSDCLIINNSTVCRYSSLERISEDDCIP